MAQYTRNPPLEAADLDRDPMRQLEQWIEAARAAGMIEPTAMTLATASAEGVPSARIVLYKGQHDGGPVFYSNYQSHKGRELQENPHAALVFWWDRLERQVRIEGRVERLPRAMSDDYFKSRPFESQVSAAVSRQSQPVASRDALDERMRAAEERARAEGIECPAHWGGYCLRPTVVEFWQGRHGRAHDRLCYRWMGEDWRIERLEP